MLCSFFPDLAMMIMEKYDNLMNPGEMLQSTHGNCRFWMNPFMMGPVAIPGRICDTMHKESYCLEL